MSGIVLLRLRRAPGSNRVAYATLFRSAIPHAYCDRIDEPVAVLGRSQEGIDFEACDNAPVHFVILLMVPKDQPHLHLQTLASIGRLFSQCEVRKKLKEANSAGDLLEALGWCEDQAA